MSLATKRMVLGCVCLLGGLALGAFGLKARMTAQRLDAEGVVVTGQVVDSRMTRGRRGSKSYHVVVEYSPEGKALDEPLTHRFSVSSSTFDATQAQRAVSVRHLPSDPTVVGLEGERDYGMFGLVGGPILALVGLGFVGYAIRTPNE